MSSFVQRASVGVVAAVLLFGCRKQSPDEIVTALPEAPNSSGTAFPPVGGSSSSSASTSSSGSTGSGGDAVGDLEAGVADPNQGSGGDPGSAEAGPVDEPDPPFSKRALLAAVATCAVDRFKGFASLAHAMQDKTQAWVDAPTPASAGAAESAWRAAMASWQEAELFRLGPALPRNPTKPNDVGQSLRDEIYSWPVFSTCLVDEQIVNRAYQTPAFATSRVNGRGLSSLEYLMFSESTANTCTQFSAINSQGTWAALSASEIGARRVAYAARVSKDVAAFADKIVDAWDPAGGNFKKQLAEPGSGVFADEQDALNSVSDAMFYIEIELKDMKLGRPLGLSECFKTTCPELLESPYARVSTSHVRANLASFRRLFQGCKAMGRGLGFEDWLREVGASDLADRMLAALDRVELEAGQLNPLEQVIVTDPAGVKTFYTHLKVLTDLLKTEFVTVLNLEIPQGTVGDND